MRILPPVQMPLRSDVINKNLRSITYRNMTLIIKCPFDKAECKHNYNEAPSHWNTLKKNSEKMIECLRNPLGSLGSIDWRISLKAACDVCWLTFPILRSFQAEGTLFDSFGVISWLIAKHVKVAVLRRCFFCVDSVEGCFVPSLRRPPKWEPLLIIRIKTDRTRYRFIL